MKSLIIILLLSVPALMQAQTERDLLKAKSEVVRKKIQKQLEYSILDYKQLTCPEIDYEPIRPRIRKLTDEERTKLRENREIFPVTLEINLEY